MPDFLISPLYPWLAPLAGFSDLPFRLLCRKYGCSIAETEMVSAKGLFYNTEQNLQYITTTEEDSPLVVQLFGSDPKIIVEAIKELKDRGYKYFDLNAGCPVKKVTKTGAGAALLKDIDLLTYILDGMANIAGNKNIGVKIRLGWHKEHLVYLHIGDIARKLDIGWITLHPRFAKQGFSGQANWEHIKRLKQSTSVYVIASGDLFTALDGFKCIQYTKADSLMFARGALKNPLIFKQYKQLHKHGKITDDIKLKEKIEVIKAHIEFVKKFAREKNPIFKLRGILSRYIRGIHNSKYFRKQAVQVCSWEDIDLLLSSLEEEYK